jgi:hypothetical protein
MAANRYKYGARNGMSTVVSAIRFLCHIYSTFSGAIVAYITENVPDSGDRTTVLNWLNAASAVCAIIETTVQITTEN